jgi:hypothetical protein
MNGGMLELWNGEREEDGREAGRNEEVGRVVGI